MSIFPELQTPAFLVDLDKVERNSARMREKARRSAVVFRPHVKTHKTVEAALLQHGGQRGPITVSTLAEAEFFAEAGFGDITYAVPVVASKLDRCVALSKRLRHFGVLFDHEQTLDAIIAHGRSSGVLLEAWMKIDSGYGRAGVDPGSEASLALAVRANGSQHVRLAGVLTHAGHSYHATTRDEILAIARQESDAVTLFATRAREAGVAPLVRSIGSTPTASVVQQFSDTDEVRPGNYVFYDAFQASIGACSFDDVAVSVLTSVIGVYPERNEMVIDAGALALSKDRGADYLADDPGFGLVCDLDGKRLPMRLVSLSQEHGRISVSSEIDLRSVVPGSRLRIVPNHSCLTAAMFERYFVVQNERIVAEWIPARGW